MIETLLVSIGFALLAAILGMTCVFVIAKYTNRYDVIDSAWGLVFISIAAVSYFGQPNVELVSAQTLVFALITIWGVRLSVHIYTRCERAAKEDARYTTLRRSYEKKAGGVPVNMYLRVYIVQAILAVLVSLPMIVLASAAPQSIGALAIVGVGVWLVGFLFEAISDYQLAQHSKTAKGSLMTSGLWKYTRHPNYFGEVTQWWGIFLVATIAPLSWIALVGPLTITTLILFVSGVSLSEKRFEGRKGWADYKRRTSMFLPLPPKKR